MSYFKLASKKEKKQNKKKALMSGNLLDLYGDDREEKPYDSTDSKKCDSEWKETSGDTK